LAENGAVFTANDLACLLESAYETAWRIHSEIKHTLLTEIERLGIGEVVPSHAFGDLIYKRSSETPANQRPIAEESKLVEETRIAWESSQFGPSGSRTETYMSWKDSSNGNVNGTRKAGNSTTATPSNTTSNVPGLNGLEQKIFESLTDEFVSIDKFVIDLNVDISDLFAAITTLELEGLIVNGAGNQYARAKIPGQSSQSLPRSFLPSSARGIPTSMLPPLNLRLNNKTRASKPHAEKSPDKISTIIDFLDEIFHGISRKYLQLYLAWYWFCNDTQKLPISLFRASYVLGSISGPKLKTYNSPLMVRICA